ncbi:MAG: CBS domain-containing protein [Acidobacteria bacterium]|nr:CBS domain-containing protein [Acidobacteriota bacterium]
MAEAEARKLQLSLVRDYMTAQPETLNASDTLLDAVLLLRRTNLRHIPILEDSRLAGILTDRDVARSAPSMLMSLSPQEYNRVFEETLISKIMTRDPLSTTPDTPLADAVRLLHQHRLGCLPVVEGGQLVGIITTTDMLRVLHELIGNPAEELPPA